MTISSETSRVAYTGAGSAGPFTVPFYFLENDDLKVIRTTIADGAEILLVLTTDYTVSGAGNPAGGSITLTTALSSSYQISITRDPDAQQQTDYTAYDKFPAESHERALDKLTMLVQRVKSIITRSLRQSDGDNTDIGPLPATVARASKFLAFDASGNPIPAAGTGGGVPVSSYMATVLDDTTAAAARATLGSTTVGDAVFIAISAATARAALGSTPTGDALFTATSVPAARASLNIQPDSADVSNLSISPSVAANALTVAVKTRAGTDPSATDSVQVSQRNATLGTGDFNVREITAALSMVVSSGSTLGHTAARLCPIYVYLIDGVAGAQELAVCGSFQGESGIFTTTAEGGAGAADAIDVMYSTNARSNTPGRLVGILWSNQTTAGTWAAAMTEVKLRPFNLERVSKQEDYTGGVVPYGSFLADGSNVSRTTYAKLFAKIGTTWGVGDGSTTFGLPDSRRRVPVGSGGSGTATLGNAVGNTGGEETHAQTSAEIAVHTHPVDITTGATGAGAATLIDSTSNSLIRGPNNTPVNLSGVGVATSTGSGTAFNVMQPSMVVTRTIRWLGDI